VGRRLVPWEESLPRRTNESFQQGEGGFPKKESLPRGNTTAKDDDVPKEWMEHCGERRMGVP